MPFHLNPLLKTPHPSGESDKYLLPVLSKIHFYAFLSTPFYSTLYPGPPSTHPGVIDSIISRHQDSLFNDPTCHFISLLHCDEPETGEPWKVIAFIKYRVFQTEKDLEGRSDVGVRQWPEGTHLPMAKEMWGMIADARRRYGKTLGPHVDVEILATDPSYHRMGAGRMLMQRVCREADELGLQCYLEGSEEGRRLYEACGFVGREDLWLDLGRWEGGGDKGREWRGENAEQGGGEGWYNLLIMLRPTRN